MYTSPLSQDFEQHYIPTCNQMGFMLTKVDPFVQRFVDSLSCDHHALHLDVGAAYGIATLAGLEKGARLIANDLDESHLNIIQNVCKKEYIKNLFLMPGDIRTNITLELDQLDSILFSRVLHFLDGPDIIAVLQKAFQWLKNGKCIYVINETPYFGTFKRFLPEYQKRKSLQMRWPGYMSINEVTNFIDPSKRNFVENAVHLFDVDLCFYVAKEAGFKIVDYGFLNREGFFPNDALYDGRESIWFIAQKEI